jgi:dihydrofolate reductase
VRNKVFIATSLDNYIADEQGGIDWLTSLPPPAGGDGGFGKFMESVDGVLMGRKTFEKVLSFGVEWPYSKKVFVWTKTLHQIPGILAGKVEFVSGEVREILQNIEGQGISSLYVDGGQTIQTLLKNNLIHELIITQVPLLLGRGISLFNNIPRTRLQHQTTRVFDNGMVQTRYLVAPTEG